MAGGLVVQAVLCDGWPPRLLLDGLADDLLRAGGSGPLVTVRLLLDDGPLDLPALRTPEMALQTVCSWLPAAVVEPWARADDDVTD